MRSLITRLVLAALIAVAVAAVVVPQDGRNSDSVQAAVADVAGADRAGCASVKHYTYILKRRVVRFSHAGGDYNSYRIRNRGERRLDRMKDCLRANDKEVRLRIVRNRTQNRRDNWRFHRYIDGITPWGEWAIPTYIVSCESGGVYTKWNYSGSGASGAYQIMPGTWSGYGGTRWTSHAAYARPWMQHIVAHRIYSASGTGPWSCA